MRTLGETDVLLRYMPVTWETAYMLALDTRLTAGMAVIGSGRLGEKGP